MNESSNQKNNDKLAICIDPSSLYIQEDEEGLCDDEWKHLKDKIVCLLDQQQSSRCYE